MQQMKKRRAARLYDCLSLLDLKKTTPCHACLE
jgi:hypothetical protein